MKVLLLCGSGSLGLKVLYCVHAMGAYVETAGSSGSDMLRYSRYSKHHKLVNFWSGSVPVPETQDWLCRYVKEKSFDIVVPSDIESASFLAATKNVMNLPNTLCFPCSNAEVLDTLHNKWMFAEVCRQQSIPTPTTILLESADHLEEGLFDEVGFPLMVKPLEAESSHGVVRLNSYKSLLAHVQGNSRYAQFPLIAQSFIPGQDIDISILAADGQILCSTVQSWINDAILEFTSNPDLYDTAARLIRAFHYDGLAHFDMRIDMRTDKLYVLECNPRAWYTINASMWHGLNFVEMGVSYAREGFVPPMDERSGQGRYCLPGSLLKQFFLPFSGWQNISTKSVRAFLQAATDPLPHIFQKVRNN